MTSQPDAAATLGMQFFGSMTASISHELKNALAIVNEHAGLLADLALLMEKGRPLDPERLQTMAEKIRQQVQRADGIIRRLNRFAHSAQDPAVSSDVREILEFTVALATRLANMKGVVMTVVPGAPVLLEVAPFQLENLLWLCLKHLFVLTEGGRSVEFVAAESGNDVVITVHCGDEQTAAEISTRIAREGQPLLAVLQATLLAEAGAVRFTLPKVPVRVEPTEQ